MKQSFLKSTVIMTSLSIMTLCAWKAQECYHPNNSDVDGLLEENSLALSESHSDLKFITWHPVYKVTKKILEPVYDDNNPSKLIGYMVEFKLKTAKWQTCDKTTDSRFQTKCYNDICTTEACALANGYQPQKPTGIEFDTPLFESLS